MKDLSKVFARISNVDDKILSVKLLKNEVINLRTI